MKRIVAALAFALLAGGHAGAATTADGVAAYGLGLKQRNGIGMPVDLAGARAAFARAAGAGVPAAMFTLAQMLAAGEGGPRDDAGARRWIAQAAEQEYPEALQQLAMEEPDPVRKDDLMRAAAHALEHRAHEGRGPGY